MTRERAVRGARAEKPTPITPALLARWPLPELDGKLGKEARGQALVVGGSEQIPGAVMLAALGALRAGAGKLQIATSDKVATHVAIAVPEARVIGLRSARNGELAPAGGRAIHDEVRRCDALLVGPGMVDAGAGVALIAHCLKGHSRAALIVDAAPLTAFRDRERVSYEGGVVITPHAGEMASLCKIERDAVLARPLEVARETAARLGVVVALKGADTYVAGPDGAAFKNSAGNLGLGTSGSGDTLSGIIAGLCARGADPLQAAVWGVYLHAKAGDLLARKVGPLGYLARELLAEVPALLAKFTRPAARRG